ncbi:hypothetical protein BBW65_03845 [Helicobacter enhydrae]|uniref:DUF814 domain-containing protein n=1 Tax=Helicobacter enhydrae TaxID=222136 RepID=A0A1B1U5D6_9HELI|nr:NFACT family protein [Helicobacter enhydrae]ANV97983.1 hypothetical protein BBW65_03845 [Helicobacter enhydrae]
MKLSRLKAIAQMFGGYQQMYSLRRVEENLFCLCLDFDTFYLDMTRGRSAIFVSEAKILGNVYQSAFDLALLRYCSRSKIERVSVDGNNRILVFEFWYVLPYKQEKMYLHFECTGRYTNVILCDSAYRIVDCLHHITQGVRVIRPKAPFVPLPQPQECVCSEAEPLEGLRDRLGEVCEQRNAQKISTQKANLKLAVQKKYEQTQEMLCALPQEEELQQEADKMQKWGSLILAHLHKLGHFESTINLQDMESGECVEIAFPSKVYAYAQGANYFFAQSKKAKKRLQNLHLQQESLKGKMDFLLKKLAFIDRAESYEALRIFETKTSKRKKEGKKDYESFFLDAFKVSMGRNAKENIKLLQDAKGEDLWLHLQGIPSSHMIIHCGKQAVREEVIAQSAKILAGLNGILDKNIVVDYTKRKFVKIVEGSNVVYAKQKSLRV